MKKIKNAVLIMFFVLAATGAAFFAGQHYVLIEFKGDIDQISETLNELMSRESLTSPQVEGENEVSDTCDCVNQEDAFEPLHRKTLKEYEIFSPNDLLYRNQEKLQPFPHTDKLKAALEPGDYDIQKAAFLINNLMFVYSRDNEAREVLWSSLVDWSEAIITRKNYLEILGFLEWFESSIGQLSGAVKEEGGLQMYMQGG